MSRYKNKEGYADPTAGEAMAKADWMPDEVYEAYKLLNTAAGTMGLEISGIRDKKTRKEWRR